MTDQQWVRVHLECPDLDAITIDLLIDAQRRLVRRVPFCGWWGKLGSTSIAYMAGLPDGRVDFGSDEDTNQTNRYGKIDLHDRPIELGRHILYADKDYGECEFVVTSIRDLAE